MCNMDDSPTMDRTFLLYGKLLSHRVRTVLIQVCLNLKDKNCIGICSCILIWGTNLSRFIGVT